MAREYLSLFIHPSLVVHLIDYNIMGTAIVNTQFIVPFSNFNETVGTIFGFIANCELSIDFATIKLSHCTCKQSLNCLLNKLIYKLINSEEVICYQNRGQT